MSTSADDDVPMVRHLWTADPSAHIFDEKLWLYTSHDRNDGTGEGEGGQKEGRYERGDKKAQQLARAVLSVDEKHQRGQ